VFNRQKIGTKLGMGFAAILLVIILVIVVSIWELDDIGHRTDRITTLRTPTVQASTQMENGINKALAALRGWMLLGKGSFRVERKKAWENIHSAKEAMDTLSHTWTNPENVVRLGEITTLLRDFKKFQDEIEVIAQQKDNVPAIKMLLTEAVPRAAIIVTQITAMIEIEKMEVTSPKRKQIFSTMVDFRGTMAICLANIRAYLLSGEERFQEEYKKNWIQNERHFKALKNKQIHLNSQQIKQFAILEEIRIEFSPLPEKIFAIRSGDKWNIANYWLKTKAVPKGQRLIEILDEMVVDQYALLQAEGDGIQNNITEFTRLLWWLLALAFFASVGIATYITRQITIPLHQAVGLAEQVAEGKFKISSSSSSSSSSSLETERLLKALRKMAARLEEMVGDIRASETRTKAIVETAFDAIITMSSCGVITSINVSALKLFGYSASDVIGKNISLLMPEPDKSLHDGYLDSYMKTGIGRIIGNGREVFGQRKDGVYISLFLTVSKISVNDDVTFCGILRDLTNERNIQAQLLHSGKLAGIGTLATGIAHELRQPLAVMSLTAQDSLALIEEDDFSLDEVPRVFRQVIDNCQRMNNIVDHLRSFAREGEGNIKESVCLDKVLKSSFTLLDAQLRSWGIKVTQDVAQNLSMIKGNANQLEQVLINLLSNAQDALEGIKEPVIKIKIWQEGGKVILTLSDNGTGVSAEIQHTIFDPFFTTKEIGKGTGLGLSISHGIITEHGGMITVSDAPGGGAEFKITLPMVAA